MPPLSGGYSKGVLSGTKTYESVVERRLIGVKNQDPFVMFAVDGFRESVDVNPAGGIHERFSTTMADELEVGA